MTRECRAPGCGALTTRYGVFCSTHKSRNRRHGAPDQRGITKAALQPYKAKVEARITENEGKAIWCLLDDRWLSLVAHAKATERATVSGWNRKACQEVSKLGAAVEPREIVTTVLAVYMMQYLEPHRFRSDKAFEAQLVRRLRGLTQINAKMSTSGTTGRASSVYTEATPRVTTIIAQLVISVLGQAGVWIAQQERAEGERKDREREALSQGLSEVSFG